MPRRVLAKLATPVTALSFLLAVATTLLWGWSSWQQSLAPGPPVRPIISFGDALNISCTGEWLVLHNGAGFSGRGTLGISNGAGYVTGPTPIFACNLGDHYGLYIGIYRTNDPRLPSVWWTVAAPPWLLLLIFSILPAIWLRYRLRRWSRPPHPGLCPACGYDLRASRTACPECGAPVATASAPGPD